ncbi:Flp pilus assembly protein CpaB [Phenylobacterium sp.]|uniref:Flp pilus assembly protein CpaB n=1 Tax=Phenylobacterium sp. TaxID=1871053 RepID=UPI002CCA8BFA|nr:Flp pilus assembly protein CpaB [Phenylobacterium sp.]HLZ73976.1 Flp pilus assembly protein CpaB [Phenylobacterium sp.]
MRVVTIVSLGACALFGLSALVVAKTMMPNPGVAKAAAPQPMAGVPIVVAKSALKFGDKLDASKIEVLKVPSNAVPDGAFATTALVLSQDGGGPPVVLTPIAAREPLLPAKLSGPGARASVAAEIHDGMRAYTIKVSDVTGVGGHALPGDRVDVVLMRDLSADAQKHNYISQVVIQDIRVLGVDLNADLASNKPATPSTATLEVSVADAQKLAVAGDLGKLSLALRKTGSAEIAQTAPMRTEALFGGQPRSTGHATVRRVKVAEAMPAAPALITIVAEGGSDQHPGKARAPKPAPAAPPATPAAPAAAPNPAVPGAGAGVGAGTAHTS